MTNGSKKSKNIEKSSVYLLHKSKVCLIIHPCRKQRGTGSKGIDQQPTSTEGPPLKKGSQRRCRVNRCVADTSPGIAGMGQDDGATR